MSRHIVRAQKQIAMATVLLMSFALVGCNGLTTTLDAITIAVDAAVPILAASGVIPPGTATIIMSMSTKALAAVNATSTELASTDSQALKTAKIAQIWASVPLCAPTDTTCSNILPAGTPTVVITIVQAISNAIVTFLQQAGVPPAQARAVAAKAAKMPNLKFSESEDSKIKAHVTAVQAKLAAIHG